MSLLQRLFGWQATDDPYATGIALYEQGRYAEAIEHLRLAAGRETHSLAGSLASFYLRQALVSEGRRLLRADRAGSAVEVLDEVLQSAEAYADAQFLYGAACGLAGDWDSALRAGSAALRQNPDYCDARLLEACSLQKLQRPREATASLNKLLESGRRLGHALIDALEGPQTYDEKNLPEGLVERLTAIVGVDSHGGDMAAAVVLCRSGRWDEGIAQLRRLVAAHPHYPDYHVKLAGALYQTGQLEEAEAEVQHALQRNPSYHAALCLRALLLAESCRLEEAWQVATQLPSQGAKNSHPSQEELFAAYLSAALGLLTGRLEEAKLRLDRWGDLSLVFPFAKLLLAAIAELDRQPSVAGRHLADLCDAWPNDVEFFYCQACHHLALDAREDVKQVLACWPTADPEQPDDRQLLIEAMTALAREELPPLVGPDADGIVKPVWRWLEARKYAVRRLWPDSWQAADRLWQDGYQTEPLVALLATAGARLAVLEELRSDWKPPRLIPAIAIADTAFLLRRQGSCQGAERLLEPYRELHPEDLRWRWLSAAYWLDPVRRWIG